MLLTTHDGDSWIDFLNAQIAIAVTVRNRKLCLRWEPAITVPGDSTNATVPNLTAGEEYEFRVIAVNKGGPSDPSDPSPAVIAKPRNRSLFSLLCFNAHHAMGA